MTAVDVGLGMYEEEGESAKGMLLTDGIVLVRR